MDFWKEFLDNVQSWNGCDEDQWTPYILPMTHPTFVGDYTRYGVGITEAPAPYHVITALLNLSVVTPTEVAFPGLGVPLHANLFAIVVGPSGEGRKSHSIRLATSHGILREADPSLMFPIPGSAEFLEDFIVENPRRLMIEEEGGAFLHGSIKGSHLYRMRKLLQRLWDTDMVQRATREKKRNKEAMPVQTNPRLSFGFATTVPDLEVTTDWVDWRTGFTSRFLVVYCKPKRDKDASSDELSKLSLVSHLRNLAQELKGLGSCQGFTDDAKSLFRAWKKDLPQKRFRERIGENAMSSLTRTEAHVQKVAMLYAFDRHTYAFGRQPDSETAAQVREPWWITVDDLKPAMNVGNMHLCSTIYVTRNIAKTNDGRMMRDIEKFLGGYSKPRPIYEVYIHLDVNTKITDGLIASLEAMKKINRTKQGDHDCIFRIPPPDASAEIRAEHEAFLLRQGPGPGLHGTQSWGMDTKH